MLMRVKNTPLPLLFLAALFGAPAAAKAQHRPAAKDSVLQEVVVTGQYAPQSMRQSVYKVRSISGENIRLHGATDVLGALNTLTGIRFSTDATLGETDIQLMGISGQEVKVLLDGVPLVDRDATKQSLSQIDINSIERIEVVEGPMSVVYGSDALAGVINIITKKNPYQPGAAGLFRLGVKVQEESMGKEFSLPSGKGLHHQHINAGWQKGRWDIGASFTRNNSGGWQGDTTGRAKEWMPKDQTFAGGTLSWQGDRLRAAYRIDYLDETLKSLGNYFPPNYSATDAWYITNRYTHLLQLDYKTGGKWGFNGAASYQNYQRRTQTTDINVLTGRRTLNLNSGSQDTSNFLTWFARGTAQYAAADKLALQGGLEFKHDHATGQRISGEPSIADYSLFLSGEYKPVTGVNIRPGIRFSKNSIYDAPPVVPALNVKIALSRSLDLRVAYARGFRAPALRELYFNFHDANHDINGNPNLKAEYSNSFNSVLTNLTLVGGGWAWTNTVTGFYNDYRNFITLALAGNNQYYYFNLDRNRTTGGTFESVLKGRTVEATLGFSYIGIYNKYKGDTAYKSDGATSYAWTPEITANIIRRWKKIGLEAALFYKYTGRQPSYELVTENSQETVHLARTGAFSTADLTVSKTLGKLVSVNLGARNLFNVTRINNSSLDVGSAHSTGGPILKSYGRSYFLGCIFQWKQKPAGTNNHSLQQ